MKKQPNTPTAYAADALRVHTSTERILHTELVTSDTADGLFLGATVHRLSNGNLRVEMRSHWDGDSQLRSDHWGKFFVPAPFVKHLAAFFEMVLLEIEAEGLNAPDASDRINERCVRLSDMVEVSE